MYKIQFTHQIMPGKVGALKELLQKRLDKAPKDSAYAQAKRYLSVTGNVTEFVFETDRESLSSDSSPWIEWEAAEFQELTVPGSNYVKILKEIEFE